MLETEPTHRRQARQSHDNDENHGHHSVHGAAAASLAAAALLAACGGGGSEGPDQGNQSSAADGLESRINAYISGKVGSDEEAARFLLQAQFHASDEDIAAVRDQGYAAWLAAQLQAPAAQTGVQWLDSRGYGSTSESTGYFDLSYPADFMIWQQLMKSPDGVRKRLALALSEFFVVSINSVIIDWRSHAVAHYWDVLAQGTRGNFRDLLEEITLNPAMGAFLNTKGNTKEDDNGRQPDENYAREVMQLFTIGLHQLNADGTERRGGDGATLPSFTASDVSNLARVFTGYELQGSDTANYAPGSRGLGGAWMVQRRMALIERRHSTLEAKFLGTTVAAGTDGATALRIALDTLFNHPNVGPFFGRQMIQRLVTSNPSPGYVARVAGVFNDNGEGVRGDLPSVFAAILLDEEARGPGGLGNRAFGKLREPMLRLVQWGRTFNLNSQAGSWKLDMGDGATLELGQNPLRSPSVFNFFRPGYVPPSTVLAGSRQVAPEFQIVNESTVGSYLNFMQAHVRDGFSIDSPYDSRHTYHSHQQDITPDYSRELRLAHDAPALVRRLKLLLCAGQLGAATEALIVQALQAMPVNQDSSQNTKLDRVAAAVLMVMASAEYLVQK